MSLLGLQHRVPPETDPPPDYWSGGRNDDQGREPDRLEAPPGDAPAGPPAAVPVRARVRRRGRGRAGRAGRHAVPARAAVTAFLSPGSGGGYAQYAVVKEIHAALKPSSLSFPEAAALPVAGLTVLQALRGPGAAPAGRLGARSRCAGGRGAPRRAGRAALGARVAGTCGPGNVEFVRGLGADPVLDSTRDDLA